MIQLLPGKPPIPKRRPLSQFGHGYASQPSAVLVENPSSGDTEADDTVELPPLIQSAAETFTPDASVADAEKPMPSLTERTIETLSKLPSSPIRKQRGSTFFDMPPAGRSPSKGSVTSQAASRPGSSSQSETSTTYGSRPLSRPESSSGSGLLADRGPNSVRPSATSYKPPSAAAQRTPSKRLSTLAPPATLTTMGTPKLVNGPSVNNTPRAHLTASVGPHTTSSDKSVLGSASKLSSKTMAVRPLKTRGSVKGLFNKASMPSSPDDHPTSDLSSAVAQRESLPSFKSSTTPGKSRNLLKPATNTTPATVNSGEETPSNSRKSSAALRDQIAKAKAAKRAASTTTSKDINAAIATSNDAFNFELSDDPFGQKSLEESNKKVMQSRIETARVSGRLNITAMGLKEIPNEVLKMYDLESIGRSDGAWAESVDLTKLIAADNDLEIIDDSIFPDIDHAVFDSEALDAVVDDGGHIFWGLESADLHNNNLVSLPLGLRRLQALNTLNLTSNKLTNNCLEIIAQCANLRDLKLGKNLLQGPINNAFVLENLEILDLHGNNISALPSDIDKLKRLRILNLDENSFESLPFQSLSALPLNELHVRKNKLQGTLIESGVEGLPQLQILDCSNNQLSYLISPDSEPLNLPALHQLTASMNQLKALPDMTNWPSILTINADVNRISAFPEGFTSRETLRHAEFSSNDIRIIPPEIARMDSLVTLQISGNPLREKKFASLTTEAMKDALLARLEPLPSEVGGVENFANGIYSAGVNNPDAKVLIFTTSVDCADDDDAQSDSENFATPPTSAPHSPARSRSQSASSQTWTVKPGGMLDRSNTQSSSLHPVVCSKIAAVQSVREVRLDHNMFSQFPNSLSFFSNTVTSLSLAHNQLTGEGWLTEKLDLTALRELNLQSNFCTSLTPLTTHLCAPNLEKLDVSLNRIVRIPILRDYFPNLAVLLIANNRLEELDPDTIRGLKIVDASNNEIAHLNPRIGLLGLDRFDVMGNRFRVPRWNVLERGTEATLRWLRGRVPVAEMGEWNAKAGITEDDSPNEVD
ncbi:L domain-like protein [Xylaria nigripes]|nr:L domain-like protein [Xylaria nigripes]